MNGHFDPAKVLKSCKFDRVAVFGNDKVLTWLNSTNKMSNLFCIRFRLALKWMSLVLVQKSVSKRKIKSTGNKSLCFFISIQALLYLTKNVVNWKWWEVKPNALILPSKYVSLHIAIEWQNLWNFLYNFVHLHKIPLVIWAGRILSFQISFVSCNKGFTLNPWLWRTCSAPFVVF